MSGSTRNAWLDTLRAVAIISVLICHVASSFQQLQSGANSGWFSVAGIGGYGVDLFFVLSGWLLGCLLLHEKQIKKTIDVKRFWIRRWLRTIPAYLVILLMTLGQRLIQGKWESSDALYFFFVQNYAFDTLPFFGISWSLCIEEQFYLLIAPLLLLLPNRVWISSVLVFLIAAPATGRWLLDDPNSWVTHLRIDGCALGVLLSHIFLNYPAIWKRITRLAPYGAGIGLAAITMEIWRRFQGVEGSLPLLAYSLISGCLVIQSQANSFWKLSATFPILQYFASRSYSLYLVHIEGIAIARRIDSDHFPVYCLIALSISVLAAELLFRFVEKPWMEFRDRKANKIQINPKLGEESRGQLT